MKVYSPFPLWKMPKGEKPKHVTPTHTYKKNAQRQKTRTTNHHESWRHRLFETHRAPKCSSYPVLLVLLLVFCVGVHVGAHTGVAGRAGDAADAVGGVLPPDAQVRLLILLLLTAVAAGWGETVRGRKRVHHTFVWNMSFIKRQPISVVRFLTVKSLDYFLKRQKDCGILFAWYVLWLSQSRPSRFSYKDIFCGKMLIITIVNFNIIFLFKYPRESA